MVIALNCKDLLKEKIINKTARVGVVGLGYVGLPLAVEKAKAGFRVTGIEQNLSRVQMINQGQNYIIDLKDTDLQEMVETGLLNAADDFSVLPELDVIAICVPTPLTRNLTPDLQHIEFVTRKITASLRPGQLVTLESTTYPGTTEEFILPILLESGLKAEKQFFLVHSPERVDPGNPRFSTRNTSKIIGGVGPASLEIALCFYGQTIKQLIPVSSAQAAEMAKVFENTFRAVNIALVNEIALLCNRMNLNVWEVLDAAFTKPFGLMPFYPGPGVGGHCIPVDPHYLEWKAKEYNFSTRFIALAGEINRKMPEFVKDRAIRILNQAGIPAAGAKVLVLGIAYKKDVKDTRESPAIELIQLLIQEGIQVSYYDPFISAFVHNEIKMDSITLDEEAVAAYDLIIITTDHSTVNYEWLVEHGRKVFDTRNATRAITAGSEKIVLL